MTVSSETARNNAVGTGATATYSYTFRINNATDLLVTTQNTAGVETALVYPTDYSVSGVGSYSGGSITLTAGNLASGYSISIRFKAQLFQQTDLRNQGSFLAETHEDVFDRLVRYDQQQQDELDRSLTLPETETGNMTLPTKTNRAQRYLSFDADGRPIASSGGPGAVPISAFMETVVDDATAPAARTTLGAVGLTGDETIAGIKTLTGNNIHSGNNTFSGNNEVTGVLEYAAGWGAGHVNNLSLTASVAANALTIALKTRVGADANATTPIEIAFGNATAATGDYTVRQVTTANSLIISSGSTMGTTNAQPNRLWIVAFDDAGTIRLGAINCSTSTTIFPLSDDNIASSTAEGGAGAADSAGVLYTGTAVSSKPYRVLGYVESTQATAGTWATPPSKPRLWTSGMKLPGDVVGHVTNTFSGLSSGTTTIPNDDTVPQNTEGDEYLTQAYTPSSGANILIVEHLGHYTTSAASAYLAAAIFQDSTAGALATCFAYSSAAGSNLQLSTIARKVAGQTTSTTFKLRAGGGSAGTTYVNGTGGVARYGGTLSTYLSVTELMG